MPSSAQALPEHIQWHEGMLLVPQHFQQFDIRVQQVLQYHLQSLNPLYWGVESLTFDQALLTSGTCRLLSFRGIMPDGTFIDELPSSSPSLEADLSTLATNFQAGPLTVYLCVPELNGDSTDILGQRPRFRSVTGRSVTDMNTGESPVVIPRLELKLELIISATPPAKYISMPIARIQYDGKIYTFDTYQPPILNVTQDTLFWTICDTIASQVREKLGYVQQKLQSIEQNPNLLTTQQALSIIRIQLLSSLLAFEALQQVGSVHPFLLYCGLCTIAGTVSGISRTSLPPKFAAYNHNDALANFMEALDYIKKVLTEVQESYSVLSFTKTDRIFSLQLNSDWKSDRIYIGIGVPPRVSDEQIINWVNNAVIATSNYVEGIRESRILGATRKIVNSVESLNLTPPLGIKLVEIDADPRFINFRDNLQIFNISDTNHLRPSDILLYR